MIISPDDIILAINPEWSPETAAIAWSIARAGWIAECRNGKFDRAIIMVGLPGSGKSVAAAKIDTESVLIFDSTMTVASRREEYAAIATGFGMPVCQIYVSTSVNVCIERQKGRKFPVPADVIERMNAQLRLDPVTHDTTHTITV